MKVFIAISGQCHDFAVSVENFTVPLVSRLKYCIVPMVVNLANSKFTEKMVRVDLSQGHQSKNYNK